MSSVPDYKRMRSALHDSERHKLWYAYNTVSNWKWNDEAGLGAELEEASVLSFIHIECV